MEMCPVKLRDRVRERSTQFPLEAATVDPARTGPTTVNVTIYMYYKRTPIVPIDSIKQIQSSHLLCYSNPPSISFFLDLASSTIMAAAAPQSSNPVPGMTTYQPLEKPIVVVNPHFLAQYPVDLAVSSKIFTLGENDFKVTDVNGVPIFSIKSKHFSIHDRRFLKDASGNILVSLKQKVRTMHRRWEAFRGESTDDKDLLFTVKKSSLLQFKTELNVFLAANTAQEVPDFKVKGSWAESSCTITLGNTNQIIAQMYRRHTLASAFLDTDHFAVTIYPNVDYAFIVALVVILDEINADRSGTD